MSDTLVTCINKIPLDDPHEGITLLGGNSGEESDCLKIGTTKT